MQICFQTIFQGKVGFQFGVSKTKAKVNICIFNVLLKVYSERSISIIQNHKQIRIGIFLSDQNFTQALATGAQYMISTDLSCLMHLDGYIKQKGYNLRTLHLADVLVNGW